MYSKNNVSAQPAMGWSSYNYFDSNVNEQQVRSNAEYMAKNLKEYGWNHIIVGKQWSYKDSDSEPFSHFCIDEYSRQIPSPDRFPSSAEGNGFAPLAEYVHGLGLKFGIHIMRGIPRICAHSHSKIYGTDITANQIANPYSISTENSDMYGVDYSKKGAQEYYDSLFALYAQWGVDLVEIGDSNHGKEIEMIACSIQKCGRPIVLRLESGNAPIEKAWHLQKWANTWNITDDALKGWDYVAKAFERCEIWQGHSESGCWTDCCSNVLLGKDLSIQEQKTLLTLGCIFRSPLILGSDLVNIEDNVRQLLTNREVLWVQRFGHNAFQVMRDSEQCVWASYGAGCPSSGRDIYIALFNLSNSARDVSVRLSEIKGINPSNTYRVRNLWEKTDGFPLPGDSLMGISICAHGSILLKLS